MKIEDIEKNVAASLAVEGAKPSKTGKKITRKFLKGEITSKDAIRSIKDKAYSTYELSKIIQAFNITIMFKNHLYKTYFGTLYAWKDYNWTEKELKEFTYEEMEQFKKEFINLMLGENK